jgi:hypothetical protein
VVAVGKRLLERDRKKLVHTNAIERIYADTRTYPLDAAASGSHLDATPIPGGSSSQPGAFRMGYFSLRRGETETNQITARCRLVILREIKQERNTGFTLRPVNATGRLQNGRTKSVARSTGALLWPMG